MKSPKHALEISLTNAGRFDVIVCGGGTAGCVAALAAARNGANVLLLEAGYYLGGMITMGNAGLTKYVMHGVDPGQDQRRAGNCPGIRPGCRRHSSGADQRPHRFRRCSGQLRHRCQLCLPRPPRLQALLI